ncbi:MAG: amidohydrolase [Clostridia bacterium]|nr:amidohydrolase [Clostridia bacterium]
MKIHQEAYRDEVIRLRRAFHQIPEISQQETKTCQLILDTLKSYGITNATRLFHTGVTAVVGDPAKECVALRMDIDGLPVSEKTELPYASCHPERMHACGHDAHIAILLVTAKILKEHEDQLPCCVKLMFQPAEEGDGGALPMIKEGVLKNPEVSRVYGAHVWPEVPVGTLEWVEGASFAGCDRYEMKFRGTGGHGAMPQSVQSPLPALSEGIWKITSLGKKFPHAVVSVCACQSDGFHNVFAEEAKLLGTIRTLNKGDRSAILEQLSRIAEEITHEMGIATEFLPVQEYPPLTNHPDALDELKQAAMFTVGEASVRQGTATYAAEDFSFFCEEVPSAHIRIGCQREGEPFYPLHNPRFSPDEDCLMIGVQLFCNLVFGKNMF